MPGTRIYYLGIICLLVCGCMNADNDSFSGLVGHADSVTGNQDHIPAQTDSAVIVQLHKMNEQPGTEIETGNILPDDVVAYSKTLIGVPYQYASTNPDDGFDCSGFITYVFNHFGIAVPRSSVDFTNVGTEVDYTEARAGDLILFTGTDSTIWVVGHMGIVVSNDEGKLEFIHSTSGKAKGVVITPFENYYRGRFVKVIRIFPNSFS